MILVILSGVVFAGQTAPGYGFKQNRGGFEYGVKWLNADGTDLKDNPLKVEKDKTASYFLYAYKLDGLLMSDSTTALLSVYDENDDPIDTGDTTLTSAAGNKCVFNKANPKCAVTLATTAAAPEGDDQRQAYYDAEDGSFAQKFQWMNIFVVRDGGKIDAVGPDREPNKLTGIAVSDNSKDDDVPLTIRVTGAKHTKAVHLEFDVETSGSTIAAIDGNKFCDITTFDASGTGSCDVMVTPSAIGKTTIKFRGDNHWTSDAIIPVDTPYQAADLPDVGVNVGTLYAGYQGSNSIHRKGQTVDFVLPDGTQGVKGLVVDGPNHKLYAADGSNIYAQTSNLADQLVMTKLATLPKVKEYANTLTYTNDGDILLVGSSNKNVYEISVSTGTATLKPPKAANSIYTATVDAFNGINYLGDMSNSFITYKNKTVDLDIKKKVFDSKYNSFVVAANNNQVYAAAEYGGTETEEMGSTLFHWTGTAMEEVTLDTASQDIFTGNKSITMLTYMGNDFYAGSSDGELYRLNTSVNPFKWDLVLSAGSGAVIDNAHDKNGTLYLATAAGGVYKIPNDRGSLGSPVKIDNYSTAAQGHAISVVVDNNQ